MRKQHENTALESNAQVRQMLNSACHPFSSPFGAKAFIFCSWCHQGITWGSEGEDKEGNLVFVNLNNAARGELSQPHCLNPQHHFPRVCDESKWNGKGTLTFFYLISFLWKISIVFFLIVKGNSSAEYDRNISNTEPFGGHNLLLRYMNLCENIFLYLSPKNTS